MQFANTNKEDNVDYTLIIAEKSNKLEEILI